MEFFLELMKCLSTFLQAAKELITLLLKQRNSRRRCLVLSVWKKASGK